MSHVQPIFIDNKALYWNPSILSLPSYAPAEYLLIARILTNGLYQQSVICQANWTAGEDILKCVSEAQILEVPATAAKVCGQANSSAWEVLANIPGIHDGRAMWSDRGEVMLIVGTQCVIIPIGKGDEHRLNERILDLGIPASHFRFSRFHPPRRIPRFMLFYQTLRFRTQD